MSGKPRGPWTQPMVQEWRAMDPDFSKVKREDQEAQAEGKREQSRGKGGPAGSCRGGTHVRKVLVKVRLRSRPM